MKAEYSPEELLPLSGIQHFVFCRRQWALIHVERQWQENALTVEGKLLHQRADDPFFTETRNGVITARSVPVASYRLGLAGVCDVVEFSQSPEGVCLPGRQGLYAPAPVEYKRGHEKQDPCDEAQLCAQAICLEEMLSAAIPCGYLYYGETRHRVAVELTGDLRELVRSMSEEMHAYFQKGYTPRVKPSKACRSCSLADICLPELQEKDMPASTYIKQEIERL
ncbi:MAG: CRISPR-associated protein Cas4 [Anaerolineales bacterium]